MHNRARNFFEKYSGGKIADKLQNLAYFKYADPNEVELQKKEVAQAYEA